MKIQLFFSYYGLYRRCGRSILMSARLARYRVADAYF